MAAVAAVAWILAEYHRVASPTWRALAHSGDSRGRALWSSPTTQKRAGQVEAPLVLMSTTRSPKGGAAALQRSTAGGPRAAGRIGKPTDGVRAVPGKVPRGSFQPLEAGTFSPLERVVLDRLDRGVIVLEGAGCVLDANTPAMRVL